MSRFIAVIHGWFVSSNRFDVHELKAETKEDAYSEAAVLCHRRNSTFDKTAVTVIEVLSSERLHRKLTLRERLTGRLYD